MKAKQKKKNLNKNLDNVSVLHRYCMPFYTHRLSQLLTTILLSLDVNISFSPECVSFNCV